jgi:outer membrane protein OmpA-like peptidoglycan-associated protein
MLRRAFAYALLFLAATPAIARAQTPDIPDEPPPAPAPKTKTEAPPPEDQPPVETPPPVRRRTQPAADAPVRNEPADVGAETTPKAEKEAQTTPARVAPSVSGETGLIRVPSADSSKARVIRLSFGLDFFSLSSFVSNNDSASSIGGTLAISASPFNYFEVWLNTRAQSTSNAKTSPQLLQSTGDLGLGVKGYYPVTPLFNVAADAQLTLLSGVGSTSFNLSASQVRLRALATADFLRAQNIPLRAHLNTGIIFDGSNKLVTGPLSNAERFALGISDYNRWVVGMAVEVPVKYVTPFLEYNIEFPLGYLATPGVILQGANGLRAEQAASGTMPVCDPSNPAGNMDTGCGRPAWSRAVPQRITPGVRITAIPDLTIDAAIEIGITPSVATGVVAVPPYTVVLLASYPFDPFNDEQKAGPPVTVPVLVPEEKEVEKTPDLGQISGTVKSTADKSDVKGAVITFDRGPPVATSNNGMFKSLDLEPGPVAITVTKDGFETATAKAEVVAGENKQIDVLMTPSIREGVIRGKVVDDKDKPIAGADIEFIGPTALHVSTKDDGSFESKATAGKYTVIAAKDGFLKKERELELKGGETMSGDVLLRKRPKQAIAEVSKDQIIVKESVHFVTGEARLAPDAASVLDSVIDVLANHQEIKRLRIEGHTDNVGSDDTNLKLSQDRAAAVVQYMVQQGIDPNRLVSEGYGATRPIAPNLTRRGREQNRRVEFHIVEQ